ERRLRSLHRQKRRAQGDRHAAPSITGAPLRAPLRWASRRIRRSRPLDVLPSRPFVMETVVIVADARDFLRDVERKSLAPAALVGQQVVQVAFASAFIAPKRRDAIRDAR